VVVGYQVMTIASLPYKIKEIKWIELNGMKDKEKKKR
jgi:hypothetical protein